MNHDSYFEIGYSHTICEDYALSGKLNDNLIFAIVADGCSSSKGVDVGARLLAHSARQIIFQLYKDEDSINQYESKSIGDIAIDIAYRVAMQADCLRRQLLLPIDILDSTLLITIGDNKGNAIALCYGDGVIVHKSNGKVFCYQLEYPSGAPYYLSYLIDPSKNAAYMEAFKQPDGDLVIKGGDLGDNDSFNNRLYYKASGADLYTQTATRFSEADWVVLMSDGAASYQHWINYENSPSRLESLNLEDIVMELTDYKNLNGELIKRKMNRIKKDHEKASILHYDDMSVAGIFLT